jgi:hypothetical protein
MSELTRSLASLQFQKLWAARWGELETRLCRVEMFMDRCGPITVAQHALLRSASLRPSPPLPLPLPLPSPAPTQQAGSANQTDLDVRGEEVTRGEGCVYSSRDMESMDKDKDKEKEKEKEKEKGKEKVDAGECCETELGRAKDIYHQVRHTITGHL